MAAKCTCQCFTAFLVAAAVFILLIINIAGIVSVIIVFEEDKTANFTEYGIVIDAGSSHSALWMFSWDSRKVNNTGVISTYDLAEGHSKGIDHYAGNATQAVSSLTTLVKNSEPVLSEVKDRVWVFLGATAGMRMLQLVDQKDAKAIMEDVKVYLKNGTVYGHFVSASIIDGTTEAVSGWIAVNYLTRNISAGQTKPNPTVGSLDFGGASLEIAFSPLHPPKLKTGFSKVTLYNVPHWVYSHSYLCFGRDQMELKFLTSLSLKDDTLQNPCYPEGYNVSEPASKLWKQPCVTEKSPVNDTQMILIQGTGNSSECSALVNKLFDLDNCTSETCGINGTFQPVISGQFYGTGLFKFVVNGVYEYQTLNASSTSDWEHLRGNISLDCDLPLKKLKERYPKMKDSYLSKLCFNGELVLATLQHGLNFTLSNSTLTASQWSIDFTGKVDTVPIDWPLGYMLNKTGGISPPSKPYSYDHPFTTLDLVLSMILLSVVAVVLLLLFLATVRVFKLMLPTRRVGYTTLE